MKRRIPVEFNRDSSSQQGFKNLLFLKTGSQAVLPVLDGMEHGQKCLVSALA